MDNRKLYLKRKKRVIDDESLHLQSVEIWVSYWRKNIHRFINDYLGLKFKAFFQAFLIWDMDNSTNYIYAASRGLAKSTVSLLYAVARCILYPGITIVVVAPRREQSKIFVEKINEFIGISKNLSMEIKKDGVKTGQNFCGILFNNTSKIITKTFSEGSRGEHVQIVIVDEFAMITDKTLLINVFVPMLTDKREPPYLDLSPQERKKVKQLELNKQFYLSSMRSEGEWSWEYLMTYVNTMLEGNTNYSTLILPYHLGVKGGYISRENVEQVFNENPEMKDYLLAEYNAIPIRNSEEAFFKYSTFKNNRNLFNTLVAKSDIEYIEYRNCPEKWEYHIPKVKDEIRILSMDIAVMESKANDNTAFWIVRCLPNSDMKYTKILSYGESMHGINVVLQNLRAKQLFYEFECDYFAVDAAGVGRGVADICTDETEDEIRGVVYPAWTTANIDDVKTAARSLSPNAVPVMYAMKTSPIDKHNRFINMRDMLATGNLSLPVNEIKAIQYYIEHHEYYKINDSFLKSRLLNTFVQTNMLIFEATNLERVVSGGYFNLKEKSGKRKDRVMSLAYNLDIVNQKEKEFIENNQNNNDGLLDYFIIV